MLTSHALARLSHRPSRRALRLRPQAPPLRCRFKSFATVAMLIPVAWTASRVCFRTLCAVPEPSHAGLGAGLRWSQHSVSRSITAS
jgi:hypothetical protein